MFKVKLDNSIKEFCNRQEAMMEALLSFKKNTNARLVEVLDDDEIIFTREREIEEPLDAPTEAQITNAFESVIRNELSRLFLTIDEYNSDLATLQAEEVDEEVVNKLNYIIDDLNTHVGILQSCLTAIENKIN